VLGGSSDAAVALRGMVERAGGPSEDRLRYVAPLNDPNVMEAGSLDLILSHSVLEHVDHPSAIYRAYFRWLRPGGLMGHKIDHSSHGITRSWNGHYAVPNWLWRTIFGRRPYLLNRRRPLEHLADLKLAGFEILPESSFVVDEAGMQRAVVREELQSDDCLVRTSTLLLRKPG
jgi:SAM-dependent methyltransferase